MRSRFLLEDRSPRRAFMEQPPHFRAILLNSFSCCSLDPRLHSPVLVTFDLSEFKGNIQSWTIDAAVVPGCTYHVRLKPAAMVPPEPRMS